MNNIKFENNIKTSIKDINFSKNGNIYFYDYKNIYYLNLETECYYQLTIKDYKTNGLTFTSQFNKNNEIFFVVSEGKNKLLKTSVPFILKQDIKSILKLFLLILPIRALFCKLNLL